MPRNTREWAKREIDASINNIEWAGQHLFRVAETYKTHHPEVSDPLDDILTNFLACIKLIEQVKNSF